MLDKGVDLRRLLSGIFSILISGNRLLLPNAVLRSICLISAPRQAHGLRVKRRFLKYMPVKDRPRYGHAPFPDVFLNMTFLLSYQAIIMHT
ncbi:MAG: hypothetical protein EGQ92_05695 [Lactobacillus ruminis]|nr:hypothetical protein [Ligilactobacillus ruminis]